MELKTVKDAFDRVAKKQKVSYNKTQESVDKLSQEIQKTLNKIQEEIPTLPDSDSDSNKSLLKDLKKTLEETTQLETTTKELNIALSKYPKVLEKAMIPDISKAYRNIEFDQHIIHQIIAKFLYRQAMFDIGDCFISETNEPECSARQSFMELYLILEAMNRQNLEPALTWATSNSTKLNQTNSDLEMKLHSLQFLKIAQDKNSNEAINYARKHISTFSNNLPEIQKLMCSLLWNRKLEKSPYAEFHSPTLWNYTIKELTRQYCNLLGESTESPLSTAVQAGSQALPPLLKYMSLMVNKKQEWQLMDQMPVPVELPEELQFHSVFVCPVSKEQASEENPAMRLNCGHVLCKQSITRMSKNGSKSFKCPYCPSDIEAGQCRQLYF